MRSPRPRLPHITRRSKRYRAEPSEERVSAPRKAVSADFLSSLPIAASATPAESRSALLQVAGENSPQSHASGKVSNPTGTASVVSVMRRDTARPQLPSIEEQVLTPLVMPALFGRGGRLIIPPALKGSHEILLRQNQMADRDGLDRIQDDDDLNRLRESKMLVAIPSGQGIETDERLPSSRRFCRPWTGKFLLDLARAHHERFRKPLQVNSAVRTVAFQQRLLRTNGNAAPWEGETASPHLTGQAVDLAKHGLSMTEIAWLRDYLLPLVQQGKIDVEEEFQQACFHISVYKSYAPQLSEGRVLTQTHNPTIGTLAIVAR